MATDWMQYVKDGFFVVGSVAGLFAFLRPAAESKYQKDIDRAASIISKLDEERLMKLPYFVYTVRRIPEAQFLPFDDLDQRLQEGRQEVRFIGPLSRYFTQELSRLIASYRDLRELVQVPEWEPRDRNNSGKYEWVFNKGVFRERELASGEGAEYQVYAARLEAAADCAERMKKQFLRFQALTELHFFEAMLSRIFVPRKMRKIGVPSPS